MKLVLVAGALCLIVISGTNLACRRQSAASSSTNLPTIQIAQSNSSPPSQQAATRSAGEQCELVSQIQIIPVDETTGVDSSYDALMRAGDSVIPCLISKVGDTTSMPDPRMAPGYAGIDNKVGDVALWILERKTKINILDFLPSYVQKDFKKVGVYAYFDYVRKDEHRKDLQKRLGEWYRRKYGKDLIY